MPIDVATYNKAIRYPQRHGYQLRGTAPTSIVVHSTNGKVGSAFEAEAKYLFESADVSAHFLVGKAGQVVQFLHPRTYQAWHAGEALADFVNARSIGIECHHAVGELWTQEQYAALTALTRQLIDQFAIPEKLIETHRAIARPSGRKSDPNDWPDHDFYAWRAALYALPPMPRTVTAGSCGAIAQQDRRPDAPVARFYPPGETIPVDDLTSGYWHDARGDGFIPAGQVRA